MAQAERRSNVTVVEALRAFAELSCERGPTARELQGALGAASSGAGLYWTLRLADRGYVEHTERGVARGWRLTAAGRELYELLLGAQP